MMKRADTAQGNDPFDLKRFISAQDGLYERALNEIKNGQKRTHWMWFIFPQFDGLAYSATFQHYAIKSREEARLYLNHPLLGARLVECTEVLLAVKGRTISDIFGYPDDLKLKSSMTLFAQVAEADSPFLRVLDKYFNGDRDFKTLQLLETA